MCWRRITADARMVMRCQGEVVADLSRAFLSSNGAEKHAAARVRKMPPAADSGAEGSLFDRLKALAGDLRFCSQRGLTERFDSSIGAGSV